MKDQMDGDGKSAKLDVLKKLMDMLRSSTRDKLPKKGVSVMSVSVSKPKGHETAEDVSEPEEALEHEATEAPEEEMMEHGMPEPMEAEEAPESEEEGSAMLSEPKIPADIMEIVKMMLARKKK